MATFVSEIRPNTMTTYEINPFQELYVTDDADPRVFVDLFSDQPVRHALALFRKGHVILKGSQGSGKSMLLNLLKPRIRRAYFKVRAEFPVPEEMRCFLGAGINIRDSGSLDICHCRLSDDPRADLEVYPHIFADFVNYWVVKDVIETLQYMIKYPEAFDSIVDESRMDDFAVSLAGQDCWFGYLSDSRSLAALKCKVDERIQFHRLLYGRNRFLPEDVSSTKTSIGEPLSRVEACIKESRLLKSDAPLFVRIDQVEELNKQQMPAQLGSAFRQMINKALATRHHRVSYRIGTRRYAWENDLTIYGTQSKLENKRNYLLIELDKILQRDEDRKAWFFPAFAEEAFRKRLQRTNLLPEGTKRSIKRVFGETLGADAMARAYLALRERDSAIEDPNKITRILRPDERWPADWRDYLITLCSVDPFSAVLGGAWLRQRLSSPKPQRNIQVPTRTPPWMATQYWRKERTRQCLLQIAGRYGQRMKWCGSDSILALSSGNISIFLTICDEIWDAFLRSERGERRTSPTHPVRDGIPWELQAVGIFSASEQWYEKITEQRGGNDRQRFVNVLGRHFRSWLYEDSPMSYPGSNGFSLTNDDLGRHPALQRFLNEAVAYGELYESPHTTKSSDRRPRTKYYLSPILSPKFQVPESRTKEPFYANISDLKEWLYEAEIHVDGLTDLKKIQSTIASNRHRAAKKTLVRNSDSSQQSLEFDLNS
jgi:hypothetical protein